jgi:hypothetical protein
MANPKAQPKASLFDLAHEALESNGGNVIAARDYLIDLLRKDRKLLASVLDDVLFAAVNERTLAAMRAKRKASVRQITIDPQDDEDDDDAVTTKGRKSIHALASGVMRAELLDFPLKGGLLLRHATRDPILEQARMYEVSGKTDLHRAKWLNLVAQCLPKNKTVQDILTAERLDELWTEAENEI